MIWAETLQHFKETLYWRLSAKTSGLLPLWGGRGDPPAAFKWWSSGNEPQQAGGCVGGEGGESHAYNICKENVLFKVLNTITRMNLIYISWCSLQD